MAVQRLVEGCLGEQKYHTEPKNSGRRGRREEYAKGFRYAQGWNKREEACVEGRIDFQAGYVILVIGCLTSSYT